MMIEVNLSRIIAANDKLIAHHLAERDKAAENMGREIGLYREDVGMLWWKKKVPLSPSRIQDMISRAAEPNNRLWYPYLAQEHKFNFQHHFECLKKCQREKKTMTIAHNVGVRMIKMTLKEFREYEDHLS